jgi:2-keto-4-pentenoate hydratase/2-oxohepta-3-ene-1,7-dioic acid hydratase in catechol pathway
MAYQHQNIEGAALPLPLGKVVGVGGNSWVDGETQFDKPWLFIKPSTALCHMTDLINVSKHKQPVHAGLEVAILIGQTIHQGSASQVASAIAGYSLVLDLVLPDLHATLRAAGEPWERAKCFDGSCPMSTWLTDMNDARDGFDFELWLNQNIAQQGTTAAMRLQPLDLLAWLTQYFTLLPGDVVLLGSPNSPVALEPGDAIEAHIQSLLTVQTTVV